MFRNCRPIVALAVTFILSACSSLVANMTDNLAGQLQRATKASNDPALVASALPAYMLLIDGMLLDDPENTELLLSAANLYTAYASVFVNSADRQQKLAKRGYLLAQKGVCLEDERLCQLEALPFEQMSKQLGQFDEDDIALIFVLARSWAGHIQAASDNWKVVANLARVQALLEKVTAIDPGFNQGEAQYYLGIIKSLVPPALGGKPEQALEHFKSAQSYSDHHNLMIDVAIAERYARIIFDRELHDQILQTVIANSDDTDDFRLTNTLAREKAKSLLANADDYF